MDKKPLDQDVTIHVKNVELEEYVSEYVKNKTPENLNKLLNHIVTRRVLVPANMNEVLKKPEPCIIQSSSGEAYFPIYTSLNHVPKEPKSAAIMNMPYMNANVMAANGNDKLCGIAINPFTNNLVLKKELLKKIIEVEEMKKKGMHQVKMTGAQYAAFERVSFEKRFLPKQLFEGGMEFIQKLDERKENYLDELFEESYQQKRMYPYLEEDFSVMVMTISEELLIARVEFPAKDMAAGVCYRAFLAWNKASKTGRYFMIEAGKEKGTRCFGEVTSELKYISYGEAPVEGTELQRVVDLIQNETTYTS